MTTAAPLDLAPLPEDRDAWPPAAYGAGAPSESYASYAKLRSGEWGLRVPGGCKPGQLVVVRQRNGAERTERVRYVLWTGPDSRTGVTMSLATIDSGRPTAPRPPQSQPQRSAPQPTRKPTARSKRQAILRLPGGWPATPQALTDRATIEADKARADAEATIGSDEPLF